MWYRTSGELRRMAWSLRKHSSDSSSRPARLNTSPKLNNASVHELSTFSASITKPKQIQVSCKGCRLIEQEKERKFKERKKKHAYNLESSHVHVGDRPCERDSFLCWPARPHCNDRSLLPYLRTSQPVCTNSRKRERERIRSLNIGNNNN